MASVLHRQPGRYTTPVTRLPPDLMLAMMDVLIGGFYMAMPPLRTSAAAYTVAKELLPIRLWGVFFFVVGLALLLATMLHRANIAALTRYAGPSLFAMWAIMFGISAVADNHASFVGIPVYLYLAYRHSLSPITQD